LGAIQILRIVFFCSRLAAMIGRGHWFFMGRLGALGLLVALSTVACGPKEDHYGCNPVEATGGTVIGAWDVDSSCPARYDRVVSNDWCSQLVWDANGVHQAYLGHQWMSVSAPTADNPPSSLAITQGPSLVDPTKIENRYTSELKFGPTTTPVTFPRACIEAYGQSADDCDVFAGALTLYLGDQSSAWQAFNNSSIMLQPQYPQGLVPQPSFFNIFCEPVTSSAGGCSCTYDVTLDVPDRGTWTNGQGTILTLYSDTAALPYDLDYASDGTLLGMSGHDGLDVMGQRGLRKVYWRKRP
jgi:hypothetical protein